MRVLVVAVGSRGDVAPCAGLGQALRDAGHSVTVAAYPMFGGLVRAAGLEFRPLPGDPRLLDAAAWDRGSTGPLGTVRLLRLTAAHLRELHAGILACAREGTDALLFQGISAIGGYHIAQALGLPSLGLGLAPIYPTSEFPPSTVTARSLGRWGNRAAGKALVFMGSPVLAGPVKELRAELGLPKLGTYQAIFGEQEAARWPAFHGFSPAVVPRPADWRQGLEVTGYWWPPLPSGWRPPGELEGFLAGGPPPVFVGFGSMVAGDADRLSDLVAAAGREAGVRLVIQAGQAGLGRIGLGRTGLGPEGAAQAGPGQAGAAQAGRGQAGAAQAGAAQAGRGQAGAAQAGPGQAGTAQAGPGQAGAARESRGQAGASQESPRQAGLVRAGPSGDSIVIGDVPHEWLFPRMAAVVHHAGAGTTGAALRAGVPAVCVPKLGDQPFWAARVAGLGAGPPAIGYKRLSVPALAAAIREAIDRPSYRSAAQAMAARLAEEDGSAPVVKALARLQG